MGKIKINLTSGAVAEKPLVCAFHVDNNSYVVLDNEINGSMGLPIILVCKYDEERLLKITDLTEWQAVKDNLKSIIAGNKMEYIKVPSELSAEDVYYTQLTLPVASFDALKYAYVEPGDDTPSETSVESPVEETPVNSMPSFETVNIVSAPVTEEPTPVVNEIPEPVVNPVPEVSVPVSEEVVTTESPEVNVMPEVAEPTNEPVVETPIAAEPIITPTPVIDAEVEKEPEAPVAKENIFAEQKEAFMQACENMFDALVQKFEKELENK